MAEKNGSYAGKISHSGAQRVEAPFQSTKKRTAAVKRGKDLRSGEADRQKKK